MSCNCIACDEDKCPCMPNIFKECSEECDCGCKDLANLKLELE